MVEAVHSDEATTVLEEDFVPQTTEQLMRNAEANFIFSITHYRKMKDNRRYTQIIQGHNKIVSLMGKVIK